jgi:hypothetical protein
MLNTSLGRITEYLNPKPGEFSAIEDLPIPNPNTRP